MENKVLFVIEAPKMASKYASLMPPVGVLGLASFLEEKGYECDVIDYNVEERRKIDYSKYMLVCFGVLASNINNTIDDIKRLKEESPMTHVIIGGPYVRSNPEYFLKLNEVDALIQGEAEETLYEYLTINDKAKIAGLWIRDSNGKPVFTGNRKPIFDLDSLPFPALDKVDLKKYNWPVKQKKPISTIVSSRGCPEKCTYCSHALGFEWRKRSPENIVAEIEWQVNELGVKEICFFDDNFTLDLRRAEKFCNLVKEKKLDFLYQFPNGLRADRLNKPLLQKMKDTGCWYLAIAPETGSNFVLEKIKKGFSLEKVQEVVKDCKDIGIRTMGLFMIGFPFESKDDIEKTLEFSRKLDTDLAQFAKVTIFGDTELAQQYGYKAPEVEDDKALKMGYIEHEIPGISKEEIHRYLQRAYRGFYLRPRKMVNLVGMLKPTDLFNLAKFAMNTGNI